MIGWSERNLKFNFSFRRFSRWIMIFSCYNLKIYKKKNTLYIGWLIHVIIYKMKLFTH